MTVYDLIQILHKCNPDAEVIVDEPGRVGPILEEDVREDISGKFVTIFAY